MKRLEALLGGKEVLADLHDERTNKRLLTKGVMLDRDAIERISTRNLKRIKFPDKDPRINEQIDEIEEMTSRQIDVLRKIVKREGREAAEGRRTAAGRDQAGEGLHRHEAQAERRRQDGRPPR